MSWPQHTVSLRGSRFAYAIAPGEATVSAPDAAAAKLEAARKVHRGAKVPPYRSLLAATVERLSITRHQETESERRQREIQERGR